MLEVIVGLGTPRLIDAYVVIGVEVEDEWVTHLDPDLLVEGWHVSPPTPASQVVGNRWLTEGDTPVLRVPSVVVPREFNFVLNPVHPDFVRLRIGQPEALAIDPRLAR
jgi:RES domain-containing protein